VPPALRLPDGLRSVRGYETPVKASDIEDLLRDLGLDAQDILARVAAGGGQTRLSVTSIQGVAFRLAITRFGGLTASGRGGLFSLALRRLRPTAPAFADLGLPEEVGELATLKRGLVLITGETGAGKSTTLAAADRVLERPVQPEDRHDRRTGRVPIRIAPLPDPAARSVLRCPVVRTGGRTHVAAGPRRDRDRRDPQSGDAAGGVSRGQFWASGVRDAAQPVPAAKTLQRIQDLYTDRIPCTQALSDTRRVSGPR